jgi:hypothetical protein
LTATLKKEIKQPVYKDFSLSVSDMKFLASKMRIPVSDAKSLFEEKNDLDLIIYNISQNQKVLIKDLSDLSLYLYVKFLLFHYSKKHSFSFEEKNYIADLVFNSYPKIAYEEIKVSVTDKKHKEEMAGHCLIIVSFFDALLDKFENSKQEIAKLFLDFIVDSFNEKNKNFISENLEEWILILKKMKTKLSKKV